MLTPSPDDVRARSELLRLRFPDGDEDKEAELAALLADDAPVVSSLTGRIIGPEGTPGEEVPAYLQPVAMRAMALRAERMSVTGAARSRTGAIGKLTLRSFSAGPYSEAYFGPGEAQGAKALDLDPVVHELLWALATEEKRQEWLRLWGMASYEPAMAVQSVAWQRTRGRY